MVVKRTGGDINRRGGRDGWAHEMVNGASDDPASCPCEPMESEELLYLLYTSGTTAKPKGIIHTTGGYMVGVPTTHHYIFDIKPNSVYWCAADIGWVTGHSYIVFGPLANATTGIIYEGTPDFPDKDRWWQIVERYRPDILYTAPTTIRTHMKWGPEYAARYDLSSLRLLGTVGEPINPEAWVWYREHIGGNRTPVVDTWWQTETGMILITPLPGITTLKPASATQASPPLAPAAFHTPGRQGRVRGAGDRRLGDSEGRQGRIPVDDEGAARARGAGDRKVRGSRQHRVHAGAAEDPLGQDHAAAAARRVREPAAWRHHHARGPRRGGGARPARDRRTGQKRHLRPSPPPVRGEG